MAVATRGTPINVTETTIGTDPVTIEERSCDRTLSQLTVERGGERWTVRLHYDGAVEPVNDPRASLPVWVARVVREYDVQADE